MYQHQDGVDRVVSYASRSLKPSERNYPAHKLEFLALKWAVTEKFHDYLYGAEFEVVTDNNPLTYVFTTAKLDATGQRWLAELSNYNCSISYRSGKQNADADGLSRLHDTETVSTIFPDVLKATVQSLQISQAEHPYIASSSSKQTDQTGVNISQAPELDEDVHQGTALGKHDWRIAQSRDKNLKFVLDCLIEGHQPTVTEALHKHVDKRYVNGWERYELKDGIICKTGNIGEESVSRVCLPMSLQQDIFMAYHNNLGHQGKERTLSVLKRRFYWPGMDKDVQNMIRQCGRCIRRKTAVKKKAELVNITTRSPMELVCIDFLSLEPSKGGHESILVITDHFTRLAQAIPLRNQKATTTARALFDNFFIHYGFPGKLHSDQGANFESKVVKKLCKLAGTVKTRTTPYHPMGNGMCERFNKTLLNMLGTLNEHQKSDWKSYVPTLTHAYNAATHKSTGFAPFYLMYGRHPRLSTDAFLDIGDDAVKAGSHADYVDKLKQRLTSSYEVAARQAETSAKEQKRLFDQNVCNSVLEEGDRVLVRKVGVQGKQKLKDIWEIRPYIVKRRIAPDIPVYEVQMEGTNKKTRTLHRNMLLPFFGLPEPDEADLPLPKKQRVMTDPSYSSSDEPLSSSDSSDDEPRYRKEENEPAAKYIIPQRRDGWQDSQSLESADIPDFRAKQPPRRGKRNRKPPERFQADDWRAREHVFYVRPQDVVYI